MTCPSESTASRVLAALERFDLKKRASNFYRCNNPFRAGSNSHGFVVVLNGDDGEHGAFYDHVTQHKGSLYELAEMLDIPTPRQQVPDTKRPYQGMDDYARAHGVSADVLRAAGWQETAHSNRPALQFPTANGPRWRFLDGAKPRFINPPGYRSCWYGLTRAVRIAQRQGLDEPLVICNGEISTVVAQAHGIAACAVTSGEKRIPDALLGELKRCWSGPVLIALDCDGTGRAAARDMSKQLPGAVAVDLRLTSGGDLADFCCLYGDRARAALLELQPLADPTAFDSGDLLDMREVGRAAQIQAREWGANPTDLRGMPSGISTLDAALSGFMPDDIVIVLGKSGSGKSLIASQFLRTFAQHAPGLIFTTEMPPEAYLHRMVSQAFGVNQRDIYTGRAYNQRLFQEYENITRLWQVFAFKRTDPSPDDLLKQAEKAMLQGAKWCIVDSLNNVKQPGAGSIYDEMRATMRAARIMAHDMKMLVVLTMQAGNAPNERRHKEPKPSDGYGGQIAYHDASRFITLWRPGYDKEAGITDEDSGVDPSVAYLRVAKDRHFGAQGTLVQLRWTGMHYVSAGG